MVVLASSAADAIEDNRAGGIRKFSIVTWNNMSTAIDTIDLCHIQFSQVSVHYSDGCFVNSTALKILSVKLYPHLL